MKQRSITVFGGSGFLGSYVVRELAKTGMAIKIICRHPENAMRLKTCGTVGQINPVYGNIRDIESVKRGVEGAYGVVNLVGVLYEQGRQDFSLHSQGAENIAKAAKAAGATRFVHISALGVDKPTKSKYARTKITGEKAVLAAFPEATIFRPSILFGPEDNFFNRFASLARFLPALPLIGGGETKFQPVYVGDVAKAIVYALTHTGCEGKIYELGGPEILTFRRLMQVMLKYIGRKRLLVPVPFPIATIQATLMELCPHPMLTRDQVRLLQMDNIVSGNVGGTFADLGILPTPLDAILPEYLERYRGS